MASLDHAFKVYKPSTKVSFLDCPGDHTFTGPKHIVDIVQQIDPHSIDKYCSSCKHFYNELHDPSFDLDEYNRKYYKKEKCPNKKYHLYSSLHWLQDVDMNKYHQFCNSCKDLSRHSFS